MALFEKVSRVRTRDVFEDAHKILHFVVDQGMVSLAIGKNGMHVKKLSELMNRKVKILEFDPVRETFIKRLVFPLKIKEITAENDVVMVKGVDRETNSRIIGRNAVNLRNYENIVKRYFPLEEIKVV